MRAGPATRHTGHAGRTAPTVRAVAGVLAAVLAGAGLGGLLSACGTTGSAAVPRGTVSGTVVVTTGSTTLHPSHALTVELVSAAGARRVVARTRVAPGRVFRLDARPGRYRLAVAGVPSCEGRATLRAGHRTSAAVTCTLFRALGSVAFATLPARGAITTEADAIERTVASDAAHGTTRIEATETTLGAYERRTPTRSGVMPTHLPTTTPVWVVCASGGTYTGFDGDPGYRFDCTGSIARTGGAFSSSLGPVSWPAWFTRLPPPTASS